MRGLVSALGVLAASPELVLSASFTSIPESYPGLGYLGTTRCLPFSLGTLQPPRLRVSRPFSGPPHPLQGPLEGKGLRNIRWFG